METNKEALKTADMLRNPAWPRIKPRYVLPILEDYDLFDVDAKRHKNPEVLLLFPAEKKAAGRHGEAKQGPEVP